MVEKELLTAGNIRWRHSDLTVINAGVSVGLGTVVAVDPKAKVFSAVTQSTHHLLRKMRYNYSSTNYNRPFIAQGFHTEGE